MPDADCNARLLVPSPAVVNCNGSPASIGLGETFPDCSNQASCTATCPAGTYGNPAPKADCNLATGAWGTAVGDCTPSKLYAMVVHKCHRPRLIVTCPLNSDLPTDCTPST